MTTEQNTSHLDEAAHAFNEHESRSDGAAIAAALSDGLRCLADAFFTRIHFDVEREFGVDSMLAPVSPVKSEEKAKTEIQLFEFAESAGHAREYGYLTANDDWYLHWLARLRFGDQAAAPKVIARLESYLQAPQEQRRQAFTVRIERTFPEARRAPLILYKLFPLAVHVTTALAWGDCEGAKAIRHRQSNILSVISDCNRCHGGLLEIGERCAQCGNPLWKFEWLTAD